MEFIIIAAIAYFLYEDWSYKQAQKEKLEIKKLETKAKADASIALVEAKFHSELADLYGQHSSTLQSTTTLKELEKMKLKLLNK